MHGFSIFCGVFIGYTGMPIGSQQKHYMQDHGVAQSINISGVFTVDLYAEFTVNWVLIK